VVLALAGGTAFASFFAARAGDEARAARDSERRAEANAGEARENARAADAGRSQAEREKAEARWQQRRAEVSRYGLEIELIRRALDAGQRDEAARALEETAPDVRDWEYRF